MERATLYGAWGPSPRRGLRWYDPHLNLPLENPSTLVGDPSVQRLLLGL